MSTQRTINVMSRILILTLALWSQSSSADPITEAEDVLHSVGARNGFIVHLGCGDGRYTPNLRANDACLVHGIDTDPAKIKLAREHFNELSLLGKVTADTFDGQNLPYVDNSVNTVVVSQAGFQVSGAEIDRVLAPRGVAVFPRELQSQLSFLDPQSVGDWFVYTKPVPGDIDEWPHYLHGPDNNAVANDKVVAAPKRIQWANGPLWSRSHEYDASLCAMVSSGGRIFYIYDEGPTGVFDKSIPDNWKLIARDAFNGVLLWKEAIPHWGWKAWKREEMKETDWRNMRSHRNKMPLPRRLVALGNKVYVTLGYDAPVTELDAATGRILRTFSGTERTHEIICHEGIMTVLIRQEGDEAGMARKRRGEGTSPPVILRALNIDTGERLWEFKTPRIVPSSLAVSRKGIVFHTQGDIVCVDLVSGKERWSSPAEEKTRAILDANPTLVLHRDIVLCGENKKFTARSIEDGKISWELPGASGFGAGNPPDVFVADGLVWYGHGKGDPEEITGYDPLTGKPARTINIGPLVTHGHHFRCYRSKATDDYLFLGKRGTELIDIKGDQHSRHNWLRGGCRYGVLPCNGLLYSTPHPCMCSAGVQMGGFLALAGDNTTLDKPYLDGQTALPKANSPRLEKGPAYGNLSSTDDRFSSESWPMYRHDPLRSGSVTSKVGLEIGEKWKTAVGGDLTQPVIAGGRVFTARKNAGEILCLDARNGKKLWNYIAGGRVDSSPSWCKGYLLFGSADGHVYCLNASDGELAWRFRAAPNDRRIIAFGQLESVWPVHGSVLIADGVVYFVSGRSSYLDGGLTIYGLDAATGNKLYETAIDGPHPDLSIPDNNPHAMEGAKSDLLVTDGELIYLFHNAFNRKLEKQPTPIKGELTTRNLGERDFGRHLFSNAGFLDTSGFNRNYWIHTDRWPAFNFAHQSPKAGQIVVFDDKQVYAIKYFVTRNMLSPQAFPGTDGYYLFADSIDNRPVVVKSDGKDGPEFQTWLPQTGKLQTCWNLGVGFARAEAPKWLNVIPVRVNAMVLTANALVTVGVPDVSEPDNLTAALYGERGAILNIFDSANGTKLFEKKLDIPPVFDGISAAEGNLFMVQTDGSISCWSEKKP